MNDVKPVVFTNIMYYILRMLAKNLYYFVVVFRAVREITVGTVLDLLSVFFEVTGISGAIRESVHRAVTKQAIEILFTLMARKILAFFVCKVTIRILHGHSVSFL